MPTIEVNGVNIAYEIAGEGPTVVWTSGGWFPRESESYIVVGHLCCDFKVLLWDRRYGGASGFGISDSPSTWHLFTDDMHQILKSLKIGPAYICGGSGGMLFSLLMAHRYPEDVKGLVLFGPPTDDIELLKPLTDGWYLFLADIAEQEGMQAVIDASANPPEGMEGAWLANWIAACAQKEEDRNKILSTEPIAFATILRKWANWFHSPTMHLVNLSDEELNNIKVPTLVASSFNSFHPEHTARNLFSRLPNAEWVDYSTKADEYREVKDMHGTANYSPLKKL